MRELRLIQASFDPWLARAFNPLRAQLQAEFSRREGRPCRTESAFWVYVIACGDGVTFYVGYTADFVERMARHRQGLAAKLTRFLGVQRVVAYIQVRTDVEARFLESMLVRTIRDYGHRASMGDPKTTRAALRQQADGNHPMASPPLSSSWWEQATRPVVPAPSYDPRRSRPVRHVRNPQAAQDSGCPGDDWSPFWPSPRHVSHYQEGASYDPDEDAWLIG